MIDRNKVAAEKMARAAELMEQYGIDMWVVYSRMKTDTALELMFNTDTKNEVLFILTGTERIVVCCPEDEARFAQSGLYTKVLPVQPDGYMEAFRDCFCRCGVKDFPGDEKKLPYYPLSINKYLSKRERYKYELINSSVHLYLSLYSKFVKTDTSAQPGSKLRQR
jgi:hypothetical protein